MSVVNAVKAGAIGYMLKNTESDALIRAIKAAVGGQVQLAPEAQARLMREVRAPDSPEQLSERETDVLRLVAVGKSNKEIARELGIGEKTVKMHRARLKDALGVATSAEAIRIALEAGLLANDPASPQTGQ